MKVVPYEYVMRKHIQRMLGVFLMRGHQYGGLVVFNTPHTSNTPLLLQSAFWLSMVGSVMVGGKTLRTLMGADSMC
jgi:hypothetical protein